MSKKIHVVGILLITIIFLFLLTPHAYALKKRVRSSQVRVASYSSAKLSRDTHSVIVSFLNLKLVRRIDYVLSYDANGIKQGVVGAFVPSGQSTDSRNLYFGTCSRNVCTPHYGISRATLTITTTLSSGSTYVKRYIIKNI
ncbi:hypothetical protein A2Z00_00925 [Candidatus Gottesmanbacteria bacterium RBG_13_45_10]|uniref:Uncharacterized protein n=1 Tax=Candidatus Gottesmanbacteria bacterium RBG_13_45_10 TaxID=1798370 RepID=A0A1F5ZIF8_9BACT|nr:MAG: hypothetical protein A2Z00_00925 [Candidatus Gottesmanbacteria bacterium RBG_13_45_10]